MSTAEVQPTEGRPFSRPGAAAIAATAAYQLLATEKLVPSSTNPRKTYDQAALAELAKSIRDHGIVEPLIVRAKGEKVEIVAGERRYRAALIAELQEVPVIVRQLTDEQALEIQVIENLQRSDLHPLEEADGYRRLQQTARYDIARIAERVGRSVKYVYDRIKLLELSPEAKNVFLGGRISAGHAILLARLDQTDQKRALAEGALFQHERTLFDPDKETRNNQADQLKACSVRELEAWINEHVRFDVDVVEQMVFPDAFQTIKAAREEAEKIVPITHDNYIQEEAREGRTFGPRSWKRADGKLKSKTCEFSVTGVLVIGPGRGQAFKVCVNKDKCRTHWADEIRAREKHQKENARAAAKGGPTKPVAQKPDSYEARWKVEQAKRQAFEARWNKARPAVFKALAERVRKEPAGAASLIGRLILEHAEGGSIKQEVAAELVPPGKTAEDLVRHVGFLHLCDEGHYFGDGRALADFAGRMKANFGVDVKKIFDELAPAKEAVVERCKDCGCTEEQACEGGCAWAVKPDKKTGLGVCTRCRAKTHPPTMKQKGGRKK